MSAASMDDGPDDGHGPRDGTAPPCVCIRWEVRRVEAPADLAAFCRLEYPRLVGALSLYCGDRDLAEDLAQEALVRACERWGSVRRMAAPGAWVYRVALNLAHSHFRRRVIHRRAVASLTTEAADAAGGGEDTDAVLIRQAVSGLPRRQREVLTVRFFLDLTVEDTARVLDLTPSAVRSLTHRAVARLRATMSSPAWDLEELRDVH